MNRIITGLIIWVCWLFLLYSGSEVVFWLSIVTLAAIALNEYYTMMFPAPLKGQRLLLIFLGLIPVLAAYSGQTDRIAAGLLLSFVALTGIILNRHEAWNRVQDHYSFDFLLRGLFAIVYIGFLSSHLCLIRAMPEGAKWLTVLTSITIASDIGAYFTGKRFGKTKLCPSISPGKTVEGFGGGLFCGILTGLLAAFFLFPAINLLLIFLTALALTCLGVIGDLTESILKRAAGVKDSGRILPGHGGILDRCDSLLISAPVLFYLIDFDLLR